MAWDSSKRDGTRQCRDRRRQISQNQKLQSRSSRSLDTWSRCKYPISIQSALSIFSIKKFSEKFVNPTSKYYAHDGNKPRSNKVKLSRNNWIWLVHNNWIITLLRNYYVITFLAIWFVVLSTRELTLATSNTVCKCSKIYLQKNGLSSCSKLSMVPRHVFIFLFVALIQSPL